MRAAAHADLALDEGELNLTPYLDVVMNLVVFLMASTALVGSLHLIDVDAPATCPSCSGAAGFEPVLSLSANGAVIAASDGSVSPQVLAGPLDPAALTDALASWKQRYGLGDHIDVTATPDLPYQQLVVALDAAREDAGQPLFSTPRLSVVARGVDRP